MSLRQKIIALLGLIFFVSMIIFNFTEKNTTEYLYAISICGGLLLALYMAIEYLIIKPIKELNLNIIKTNAKKNILAKQSGSYPDKNEMQSITNQVSELIVAINNSKEIQEITLLNHEKEILKIHEKFTRELNQYKNSANKMTDPRSCFTQLARYDTLTSLPNRVFFNEILNKTIKHAIRHKKLLAILYISIDNFKNVTTNSNHEIIDQIIKELSLKIINSLRSEDVIAKLDGEEFIILLNDISKTKFASTVAEKILKACKNPIEIDNNQFNFTASIGICIFPNDGTSLEELIKNIDIALQQVKNNGGGGYQFYTESMNVEAHEFIQLEGALRNALENNELSLYFQPKIHLKKGSIVGVEALIRWTHPEIGLISPAKFIPLAEETGLIMKIGEWAILEACRINKAWQDEGYEHISVSVNLSPKQFWHPSLIDSLKGILKETNLNPNYLELEINESTIMQDIELAGKKLDLLKTLGIDISLDHFGTGSTSISHLKIFPVSTLKIDRNFIKGIPIKPNDMAITNAIIALAHNLGLNVVGEGVETVEQVQQLATMNCDIVQGYFLSHPLPAQQVVLQFKKLMDAALM